MAVNPLTLESILVKAPTEAAAFAGGLAIHPALSPFLRDLENFTWSEHPEKRLDLVLAAEVAAEDVAQYDAMQSEAAQNGYDTDRFKWAYGATLNAPGPGELLALLRRDSEVQIDFAHGLRKARLEPIWDDALRNLRDVRIPGPDLAYMVVRGVVPDGGTLPSSLPTSADRLQLPPQLTLDTIAEAAKTGWDPVRFAALVSRSGLAMGPVQAAQAYFRGILTLNDYELTIARGDLFPAFATPVLEVSRQILTAGEYAELQLRGYYDRAARLANTAKHGMSAADSDLLYNVLGRSVAVHAVTTGLARGGKYPGSYANVPQPYRAAIERSNIREEYSELAYANRYSYPSAFVVRALLTDGALTQAEGEQIFLDVGYPPDLARKIAVHYAPTATVAVDANVKKAHTKAWTEAQASYIAEESTEQDVQPIFTLLGIDAAAAGEIVSTWNEIRALVRKQLSPTQIKKAVQTGVINPATGVAWTLQDGINALLARGYTDADARVILAE